MKKLLIATAVAAVAAAPAAQAKVKISGQVNSAVLFANDLDESLTVVDNNTSGSRFRFKAAKKFGNGLKAGLRYELQAQATQSNQVDEFSNRGDSGTNNSNNNETVREVRYSDVWLSGGFGKIGIGRGDGAANGTNESYGILNFFGASEAHLLFNGAGAGYSDIDGVSRTNRVRYDSPKFSGFKFAVSLDNDDQEEFAASYNGKIAGGKIRARAGLVDRDAGDVLSYSAAYKFPFGLGLAYSYGETENSTGATTKEADWKMLSYTVGKLTVSYGTGEEDIGLNDDELSILSLNYKPTKGVEIYLNRGDWDNNSGPDGDSDSFALGGRVTF